MAVTSQYIWYPSGTPGVGPAYDLRRVTMWCRGNTTDTVRVRFDGTDVDVLVEFNTVAFEAAMNTALGPLVPPPEETFCIYQFTSIWDCDTEGWGLPALLDIYCTDPTTFPDPLNTWFAHNPVGEPCALLYYATNDLVCEGTESCSESVPFLSAPGNPEPEDCCTPPPLYSCDGVTGCDEENVFSTPFTNYGYSVTRGEIGDGFEEDYIFPRFQSPCFNICLNLSDAEELVVSGLSEAQRTISFLLTIYDCAGNVVATDTDTAIYVSGTRFCATPTFDLGACSQAVVGEISATLDPAFETELTPNVSPGARWCSYSTMAVCDLDCALPCENICRICDSTATNEASINDLPFFGGQLLPFVSLVGSGTDCVVTWEYVDGANVATLVITKDSSTATALLTVTDGVDTCEYTAGSGDGLNFGISSLGPVVWDFGSVTFQLSSGACSEVPFI